MRVGFAELSRMLRIPLAFRWCYVCKHGKSALLLLLFALMELIVIQSKRKVSVSYPVRTKKTKEAALLKNWNKPQQIFMLKERWETWKKSALLKKAEQTLTSSNHIYWNGTVIWNEKRKSLGSTVVNSSSGLYQSFVAKIDELVSCLHRPLQLSYIGHGRNGYTGMRRILHKGMQRRKSPHSLVSTWLWSREHEPRRNIRTLTSYSPD